MSRRKITEEDCLLDRLVRSQADALLALEAIQAQVAVLAGLDSAFAGSLQCAVIRRSILMAERALVPAQYDVARLARLIKPEGQEG
jgi:hypothetical protein